MRYGFRGNQSASPDQELIFHGDPHAGSLMVQTQKHAPLTLVLLDWSQAGRLSATAAPRTHRTLSLWRLQRRFIARRPDAGYSIVSGCPRERSRLLARHDPKKVCAYATNLLARFGNPCNVVQRRSGITRALTKKRSKG
jgi:hypothetical protein